MEASAEPVPKTSEPSLSARLRPEAVTERAGGQEQAGEDEHVGVDDPLQLRGEASRSRSSVGSATLRMVLSSPMTSSEKQSTTSAHQRLGLRFGFELRHVFAPLDGYETVRSFHIGSCTA
jgi:hypothetical protein